MAESWDSGNLYWGRLVDEMGYSPVMLNVLVPQLTRRMVEQTFASHLEDWSAVLRAMRETGEEFRQGKIASCRRAALRPASKGIFNCCGNLHDGSGLADETPGSLKRDSWENDL